MSFLKSPDMCRSTFSPLSTGNKVISRKLSTDSLAEVEAVLQRPPLIWDNLHANDYDSRRLFLGPFKDREPRLRRSLRGLLLNPNCEFEANYIPLHTLGSWYRAGKEESKGEEVTLKECGNSGETGSDAATPQTLTFYCILSSGDNDTWQLLVITTTYQLGLLNSQVSNSCVPS